MEEVTHTVSWKMRGFQQKCFINQLLSSSVLLCLLAKFEGNFLITPEPSRSPHRSTGLLSLEKIYLGTAESYLPFRWDHIPLIIKKSGKLNVYPQSYLNANIHSFKNQQTPPFCNSPRYQRGSRGPLVQQGAISWPLWIVWSPPECQELSAFLVRLSHGSWTVFHMEGHPEVE